MTTPDDLRKKRLEELLNLACIARGWTRTRLAKALGRDASNVSSESGNPKLDYLVRLAAVLEWPVGQVATTLWGGEDLVLSSVQTGAIEPSLKTFDEFRAASYSAFRIRDYNLALELSRRMESAAKTDDERALAIGNQAAQWNNLGRHQQAADTATRGLHLDGLSSIRRLHLESNLVLGLFRLRQFFVSVSLATDVVARAKRLIAHDRWARREIAFMLFARGVSHHELMFVENDRRDEHAADAHHDLVSAAEEFRSCAVALESPELAALAEPCEAVLTEQRVANGALDAEVAVATIMNRFDRAVDLSAAPAYVAESIGWWAISGCNISVRHLLGSELQRYLAIFSNKAIEAAEVADNWCLRERAYSLQFLGSARMSQLAGMDIPFLLDSDDRAQIASLMGRFPHFRTLGPRILDSARIILE